MVLKKSARKAVSTTTTIKRARARQRAKLKRQRLLQVTCRRRAKREKARREWWPKRGRSKIKSKRELTHWTRSVVDRAFLEGCYNLRARAMGYLETWDLDRPALRSFEELFGYPGTRPNALASNMTTRLAVGRRWVTDAVHMAAENPGRRLYMATFIDDACRTSECDTELRLAPFVKKVRNALSYAGIVDWLGCVELQPFTNWKRGRGRDIAPHAHILFWLDAPISSDARQRLERTKRFASLSGAPAVVVTERDATSPGQVAHWAHYIFKAPERGSNLIRSRKDPEKWIARDSFVVPIFAARIMEVLSQFDLRSLIIAGGGGLWYRARLDEKVLERSRSFRGKAFDPISAAAFWNYTRNVAYKTHRRAVCVIR